LPSIALDLALGMQTYAAELYLSALFAFVASAQIKAHMH